MSDETQAPTTKRIRLTFPEARILLIVGFFALAGYLLHMIGTAPNLLKDSAFVAIAMAIIGGGGLGAIVLFYFGGTKTGSDVMSAQSQQIVAQANKTNQTT